VPHCPLAAESVDAGSSHRRNGQAFDSAWQVASSAESRAESAASVASAAASKSLIGTEASTSFDWLKILPASGMWAPSTGSESAHAPSRLIAISVNTTGLFHPILQYEAT
jgi:hypothetical protein